MRINWSIAKTPLIALVVSEVLFVITIIPNVVDGWFRISDVVPVWLLTHLGPFAMLIYEPEVSVVIVTLVLVVCIASYFVKQNEWTKVLTVIGIFLWMVLGMGVAWGD